MLTTYTKVVHFLQKCQTTYTQVHYFLIRRTYILLVQILLCAIIQMDLVEIPRFKVVLFPQKSRG